MIYTENIQPNKIRIPGTLPCWTLRYAAIAFKLRRLAPCSVAGLDTLIQLPMDSSSYIQVTAIGVAVAEVPVPPFVPRAVRRALSPQTMKPVSLHTLFVLIHI